MPTKKIATTIPQRRRTPALDKQLTDLNAGHKAMKAEAQERFFNAYEACGNVKIAAETIKVSPLTVYTHWMADPEFKARYVPLRDAWLEIEKDMAEEKLNDLIAKLMPAAVFFKLKCKAKDRGYIENASFDVNIKQIPPISFVLPTEKDIQEYHQQQPGTDEPSSN